MNTTTDCELWIFTIVETVVDYVDFEVELDKFCIMILS